MPDISFYPPSPMGWILIFTVAIVAIYFTWGRKLGAKREEENKPTSPDSPNA